jgi:hypothetical protein
MPSPKPWPDARTCLILGYPFKSEIFILSKVLRPIEYLRQISVTEMPACCLGKYLYNFYNRIFCWFHLLHSFFDYTLLLLLFQKMGCRSTQ